MNANHLYVLTNDTIYNGHREFLIKSIDIFQCHNSFSDCYSALTNSIVTMVMCFGEFSINEKYGEVGTS